MFACDPERLDVGMLGAEQRLGPFPRQVLSDVDKFAPAVIPLSRIPLGVFIGHDAPGRFKHRLGNEILRCDQFQLEGLTASLGRQGVVQLRVYLLDI